MYLARWYRIWAVMQQGSTLAYAAAFIPHVKTKVDLPLIMLPIIAVSLATLAAHLFDLVFRFQMTQIKIVIAKRLWLLRLVKLLD